MNGSRAECVSEDSFKIGIGPRAATENVEAQRPVFRERVTSQMGLLQQTDSCDPAGFRKLMPACLSNRVERTGFHNSVEGKF